MDEPTPNIPLSMPVPTFRCHQCEGVYTGHPYKRSMKTGEVSGTMILGDDLGVSASDVTGFVDLCGGCASAYDQNAAAYQREIQQRNLVAGIALAVIVVGFIIFLIFIAATAKP